MLKVFQLLLRLSWKKTNKEDAVLHYLEVVFVSSPPLFSFLVNRFCVYSSAPACTSVPPLHKHIAITFLLPRHQVWQEPTFLPFLRDPLHSKSSRLRLSLLDAHTHTLTQAHNEQFLNLYLFIFPLLLLSVRDKVHLSGDGSGWDFKRRSTGQVWPRLGEQERGHLSP